MKITRSLALLFPALAACAGNDPGDGTHATDVALVSVATTSTIPPDGQCTHIIATRLSDFAVSEFKGFLAGATFVARTGPNHVTATAYPAPCNVEPATPPWIAEDQIVTINNGHNTITLTFRQNVSVGVVPQFETNPRPAVVRPGTLVRTSRNGEDAAGPNYSLDGWEVKQIALPPAAAAENVVFTTENTPVPYTPRGLATTHDGRFVVQVGEIDQPLWVFDAGGHLVATWTVTYAAGQTHWDNTDGLDAAGLDVAGNDRFVRTFWINDPPQAGIEILERSGTGLVVTKQITLPGAFAAVYPVGVTYVAGNYAVTTLPDANSQLILIDANGALLRGPTNIAGDVEGLFDDGAGHIVALDYLGQLTTYDDATLGLRPEHSSYAEGAGFATPTSLTWRSHAGAEGFIVFNGTNLAYATPDFHSVSPLAIDLGPFPTTFGIDYRPDLDQLVLIERIPPGGQPTARFFDLSNNTLATSLVLGGLPLPLRPRTIAYVAGSQRLVTHYRRPGGARDAIDSVVFVHDLGGNLVTQFDLRPFGFTRVTSVNALPSGELLFMAIDINGQSRLVVTDAAGAPKRSYTLDNVAPVNDVAPISSGPFNGDVGAIVNQPSQYLRIFLPQ